jgi:hypothetical protein
MVRIALILAAAMTLTGTAQAQSPTYRAVPATAIAQDSVIADGVMWRCGTAGCVATNATSRPAIVCAQAARQVGKLESFAVGAQAFDADALAKCNAKAKG